MNLPHDVMLSQLEHVASQLEGEADVPTDAPEFDQITAAHHALEALAVRDAIALLHQRKET